MTAEIELKSDIDVRLLQKMGDDAAIAMAAWVSTSAEDGIRRAKEKPEDTNGLIRYLVKNRHGTPFEHSAVTFFIRAPIFVWREFMRHRVGVSYNEESGRYKTLDPVFYIPSHNRPMFKVADFKPSRPKFLAGADEFNPSLKEKYANLCCNLIKTYSTAYAAYLDNLEMGFDPGLARDCLPVGIYSSCHVTMNPRSLMHLLSLRTHDPEAKHVSYPLYEIELAAKQMEAIFKENWPITYAAFCEFGRVAP